MAVKRRLISIAHSYAVGVNRRLAHELSRTGGSNWEVVAVAPRYFRGSRDLRPAEFKNDGPEPCAVEVIDAYFTREVHAFWYGTRLRQLLARPWDIVHCWEEPYVVASWQIAHWKRAASKLVFTTFQNWSKKYPPPFNWMEQSCLRSAAGWIPYGRTIVDVLSGQPGYRDRPFRMIPPGVDTGKFQPDQASRLAIRRSLNWDDNGPPVIGYLGRFIAEKGLDVLAAAIDRLTTPWRLLLIGAGPLESSMLKWARKYGDRVRLCNKVAHDQVPAYLNAMDILCAPSLTTPRWREQFGRMLIEGFACGVPVVGSDSGEIPFVLGDDGVVVPEGNPSRWAEEIQSLLESPELRRRLSAAGRERAVTVFDWSVVARQHLQFFEQLL